MTQTTVAETTTITSTTGSYTIVASLNYYRSCYGCSYYGVLGIYPLSGGSCLGICVSGQLTTNQTGTGTLNCNDYLTYYFEDYSGTKSMDFQFGFANGTLIYETGLTNYVMGTWSPPCKSVTTMTTTYTSTLGTGNTNLTSGTVLSGIIAMSLLLTVSAVMSWMKVADGAYTPVKKTKDRALVGRFVFELPQPSD
ncbi:MAG TPA: hypothetical protein VGR56_03960 [Nitrososphaerales archaeon]|nr:hypothetical protein [Nitrososphaerales archaeon]